MRSQCKVAYQKARKVFNVLRKLFLNELHKVTRIAMKEKKPR